MKSMHILFFLSLSISSIFPVTIKKKGLSPTKSCLMIMPREQTIESYNDLIEKIIERWNKIINKDHKIATSGPVTSMEEIISIAETAALNGMDSDLQWRGRQLFEKLFKDGQGFSQAIFAATTAINSTNSRKRASCLNLLKKLVTYKRVTHEAFDAIVKIDYFTENSYVQCAYLDLLTEFIKQQILYRKDIYKRRFFTLKDSNVIDKIISKILDSRYLETFLNTEEHHAIRLITELVKQKTYISKALETLEIIKGTNFPTKVPDPKFVLDNAIPILELLIALVKQGECIDLAAAAAKIAVNEKYSYFFSNDIQYVGFKLLRELVEHKQGIGPAQKIVDDILNPLSSWKRFFSLTGPDHMALYRAQKLKKVIEEKKQR